MGRGEGAWVGWDDAEKNRTRVAARLFSSGTTGLPKAVEMTHGNFVAQHMMVLEWKARDYEVCMPHLLYIPSEIWEDDRPTYCTFGKQTC